MAQSDRTMRLEESNEFRKAIRVPLRVSGCAGAGIGIFFLIVDRFARSSELRSLLWVVFRYISVMDVRVIDFVYRRPRFAPSSLERFYFDVLLVVTSGTIAALPTILIWAGITFMRIRGRWPGHHP